MPKSATGKSKPLYSVHPSVAMAQKWRGELKAKAGRPDVYSF